MEGWRPCGVQDKKIPQVQEITESGYKRRQQNITLVKILQNDAKVSAGFYLRKPVLCTWSCVQWEFLALWQTPWTFFGSHYPAGNILNYSLTEEAALCTQYP